MKSVCPQDIKPKRLNISGKAADHTREEKIAHCLYLLENVTKLLDEGKKEKASRHLAFAQGILWQLNLYAIEDLMKANMPKKVEFSKNS